MEEERSARLTLDRKFAQAVMEERRRENPKNLLGEQSFQCSKQETKSSEFSIWFAELESWIAQENSLFVLILFLIEYQSVLLNLLNLLTAALRLTLERANLYGCRSNGFREFDKEGKEVKDRWGKA